MPGAKEELAALQLLAELEAEEAERDAEITLAAAKSGFKDGYTLQLFDPIQVGDKLVSELKFRPHTIADTRKSPGPHEFTAELCGLTLVQLEQLSSGDWNAAQAVIKGFHLRRAAGGLARRATSKSKSTTT